MQEIKTRCWLQNVPQLNPDASVSTPLGARCQLSFKLALCVAAAFVLMGGVEPKCLGNLRRWALCQANADGAYVAMLTVGIEIELEMAQVTAHQLQLHAS